MSGMDKIHNAAEEAKGHVKEGLGKVTGNERLEAEGRADQASADAKQAGEHVKDAAHDTAEHVKEAAHDVKRAVTD